MSLHDKSFQFHLLSDIRFFGEEPPLMDILLQKIGYDVSSIVCEAVF